MEIWVVRPDGSRLTQITHAPPNYLDSDPAWKPDGSRLLFTRCAPLNGSLCDGENSVWSVNRNGSGLRMLTPACRSVSKTPSPACPQDGQASCSPDGRRIAFDRFVGVRALAVGDDNLRHVHLIFPFGDNRRAPDVDSLAWSPDGTRLAFAVHNKNGDRHLPAGGSAIFVINADGTGLGRITPWKLRAGGLGELDWSPDGSRILFRTVTAFLESPGPSYGNVYTIRPDGSGLHQLTHLVDTGVQLGSFSPNGKQIVYTTSAGASSSPSSDYPDVFTMDADGKHVTPVTRTKNWEGTPSWGSR